MLSSPQSITISGVATDLNRVVTRETSSVYSSTDGALTLEVSHQTTSKRKRHLMKVTKNIIAADPLTTVNTEYSGSVHIVIDEPIVGFTDAELDAIATGFKTWASSANCLAVLSGRH